MIPPDEREDWKIAAWVLLPFFGIEPLLWIFKVGLHGAMLLIH